MIESLSSSSSSSSPSSPVYWSFDEPRLDGMRRDAMEDEHFWWGIREDETRRMELRTHFLAFTSSGKPVWTRFGDVLKLSTVVGALSAICAIAEDEDDDETTVKSTEEDVSEREDIDDEKDGKKRIRDRVASVKKNRSGQLHYVEKKTKKYNIRLAVLRKGALRFAAVSRDALETEHTLRVKLDLISKAFVFLFGNAIEMNLRRSNHRFDPRKAFFREQEDVFLKSVAESGEWRDVFACTSGRVFRALAMKKERREAMTEVLRIALERCGDYSKTCFAAIYTERKGIVAYASPKTRSRGVFEGFNANRNTPLESKRPNAEDVWYLMHHVRTIDRYKSIKKKKNKKMEHKTIKTAAVANPSSSPQKENGRHQRNASFGEEMVLAGGGIVVKPPPPPPPVPSSSSSSMINTQDTALQRFKSSFCEDAYDMSICLPSGAEGAKFVLVRTMKMRLNEDELIGKEVEYDDAKVKQKLDDEIVYVSIVSKSEDAASSAHESMEELFAQLYSQNLLRDIFLATHERESDIAKTIRPALIQAVASGPSLSDDDEEESESDALLTETAKAAIEKLEHFVYAKPELGQYQIADEDEDADDEKTVRIIREYARMHAAAHYENMNRKFRDEMLEDIVKNKAMDEALESGGSTSSLSPQSSSEFRAGFFNFGGLNLNGSDETAESNLSPVSYRIFSGIRRSASEASDGSDDINNNTASQKENDNKTTEQIDNKHKYDTTLKHHRVRYESDSFGVRIACFGADFELFCQFKPNTSCQDAVATTNRLSAYLKANESTSFLMNY